jgi:transposase-like protein
MSRRRQHRLWSAEEKCSICRETRAPGVSVAQVARRHALNANLIFKWLKDRRFTPADAVEAAPVFLPVEIHGAEVPLSVKAVPAGKYGKASLEKLGIWTSVEGRLAQAENVRAALALVSRRETPLGIVYRTDVAAEPGVKIIGTFPEDSHPPIIYPVALTTGTRNAGARDFPAFLRGPVAKAAFEKQGFAVVGASAS